MAHPHIKLPEQLISYISDGYSKLSAIVKTKEWQTSPFKTESGMSKVDTSSPIIFLTVFYPLIEMCNHLSTCGFSLKVPIPNSTGLLPVNSAIYEYWDEHLSDEPAGWYYSVVNVHHPDGTPTIEHADKAKETVDLHYGNQQGRAKKHTYLKLKNPLFSLEKIREDVERPKLFHSACHSAKVFADDLSVFSSSVSDHQSLLLTLDFKCSDIDLNTLRPDK